MARFFRTRTAHRAARLALASALGLGTFAFAPAASAETVIATVGGAGKDLAHDVAVAPGGDVLVVGAVQAGVPVPDGATVTTLLGEGDGEHRGFIARFSPNLSTLRSVTFFAPETFIPSRVSADESGIYVAGDALTMSDVAKPTALLKLDSDATKILWTKDGAPNVPGGIKTKKGEFKGYQLGATGLSVDTEGRAHLTGSTSGSGQSGYLVRTRADGSDWEDWTERPTDRTWTIDLNQGAPDLEEDLFSRYDGPFTQGDCSVSLDRNRRGGQNVVTGYDGSTVFASADIQYTFNCGKSFPAFDAVLAAFTTTGKLKWATNMLENLISEPDQGPKAMHWDAANGKLYVGLWQHGSNNNRLPGELIGDTGNISVGWVGQIDPADGSVLAGSYLLAPKANSSNPGWPDNSGTSPQAITTDGEGRVYVLYAGGNQVPTTDDALQDWPDDMWGSAPVLRVYDEDLKNVLYATVLRPTSGDNGASSGAGLVVNSYGVHVIGHTKSADFIHKNEGQAPWTSDYAGDTDLFFARIAPEELPFTPTDPVPVTAPVDGPGAGPGASDGSGNGSGDGSGDGSSGSFDGLGGAGAGLGGAYGDGSGQEGGCSCRTSGGGVGSNWSWLAGAGLVLLLARARRQRAALVNRRP